VTYTVAVALGVLGALVLDVGVLRTRLVARVTFWATYPIIVGGQLLSNGVLTGLRVVRYNPDAVLGPRIGYAPVEDLAFGFALVLTSLSIWVWLGRREPVNAAGSDAEARSGAEPGSRAKPVRYVDGSRPWRAGPVPRRSHRRG
jgi:lycopene cyclase domain-containing protein